MGSNAGESEAVIKAATTCVDMFRRDKLYTEEVDMLFERYKDELKVIYDKYLTTYAGKYRGRTTYFCLESIQGRLRTGFLAIFRHAGMLEAKLTTMVSILRNASRSKDSD